MPMRQVTFTYLTGIRESLFSNASLHGSWDAQGRYSDEWSSTPMTEIVGEDGCPAFTATVAFDAAQVGWHFHWGVSLDGPAGMGVWAIQVEVRDGEATDRTRGFVLADAPAGSPPQEERYYLNMSRRIGAQPFHRPGAPSPGIRFAVWAPNATAVEVVMGLTWDINDPGRAPQAGSLPKGDICGGYVSDEGIGTRGGPSEPSWGPFAMQRQADGVWVSDVDDPRLADFSRLDHRPYMFRVTRDDGSVVYRTDLWSRCQIGFGKQIPDGAYTGRTVDLDGTVSCSVVVDPDRVTTLFDEPLWPEQTWDSTDDFWRDEFRPDKPLPMEVGELVIYELHVGALGFGKPDDQPGDLRDAMELLDHLEELGVNAVELLPLSEFGGDEGGWGYVTSHYFAVEYSGGGRDKYKWFVRECHRRGIAVILDVVYNHYTLRADRAQWKYDSNDPTRNVYYWYEGRPDDYPDFQNNVDAGRREDGGYVDNMSSGWAPRYHEEMVRSMFVSSAAALVAEFHVDGFRVDQTTSIHAYNALHADGRSLGNVNMFGQKLLRELTRTLKFINPGVMLMAEDHSNWDMVTVPADKGGVGFDATWYSDFYHHLMGDTDKGSDYAKLIHTAALGDERALAMDYFAGALDATRNRHIVYNESHDEAGNGRFTHRSMHVAVNGAPLVGDTMRYAQARCRFAAGMALLSGGTPMFLFGEEVGMRNDFLYNHVLEKREDLYGLKNGAGASMFHFYGDLIRLRSGNDALCIGGIYITHVHNDNRVLAFVRGNGVEQFLIIGSLNNRSFDQPCYVLEGIPDGAWHEVFNSDAQAYGGDNIGNAGGRLRCRGGVIACVVPANGFVVLRKTD